MKKAHTLWISIALSAASSLLHAQTVTVVEYRNTAIDAYFITGRSAEQVILDASAAFTRTGMSFTATALTAAAASAQGKVCRFYVSTASPYVSSHFYDTQSMATQTYDCVALAANPPTGFTYEGYDFAALLPTNGVCPSGTNAVYRSFRALTTPNNGKTSNHRYSVSTATYAAALIAGYVGEGAQLCVSAVSDAAPTPTTSSGGFALTSTAAISGGALPAAFTCDGAKLTLPLTWANAPLGTASYALLMTTLPGDGTTKWNWVLYNLPAAATGLAINTTGVGTLGAADDGAGNAYAPPCSQGPGAKTYTFTLYALSAPLSFSLAASQISGTVVTNAMKSITLGSALLNTSYTRQSGTPSTTAAINCALIQASVAPYAASTSVDCSASDYGKIASQGLASHAMMDGITATNLQVPIAQTFTGDNAWKIPLTPAIAATTTAVADGPIGMAINGVPIFNPCKQGGCQNGDTKVLGELDICNGHAGRADDYHYHAAPVCLMANAAASFWDTHPLGWALDGFAIFGYNNADGSAANRDAICGGNTATVPNAPVGYSYHVTGASPYVMSCLRGTPSPDLAGQGAKYKPFRQPPVTPFPVTNMTLTTDASDGYQVLQFTSARAFTTTETGSDSYANSAGSYRIRYKAVTGAALTALLALSANAGKTACWTFQFVTDSGATTQPTTSYCRA